MLTGVLDYFFVALTSMIIIINPITSAFIFLSLLHDATLYERKVVARKSVTIATIILVLFVLTGTYLFSLFGITIGAFRIAGGLILFGIAMKMMSRTKGEHDEKLHLNSEADLDDVALIPLAIPFMSGPGSIATAVLLSTEAPGLLETGVVLLAIIATTAACYYAMLYSEQLVKLVGFNGRRIITRIFGLILAVISIQFVINGINDVIPTVVNIIIEEV